jgi:hypothetical protein
LLLCDTGVLLAAGNVKDHAHEACVALLSSAEGPLLVPSPVLGEVGFLLQSRVGPHAEVTFLQSFGDDGFHVAELQGRHLPEPEALSNGDHSRIDNAQWQVQVSINQLRKAWHVAVLWIIVISRWCGHAT